MNFSSHAQAGMIGAVTVFSSCYLILDDLKTAFWSAVLCFSGSVFPDLDTESIPSRWAARTGLTFSCLMIYLKQPLYAAVAGILFFLVKSGKHRGFTHKYSIPLICFFLTFWFTELLYTAFGLGLLIHLWLDKVEIFERRNWI